MWSMEWTEIWQDAMRCIMRLLVRGGVGGRNKANAKRCMYEMLIAALFVVVENWFKKCGAVI